MKCFSVCYSQFCLFLAFVCWLFSPLWLPLAHHLDFYVIHFECLGFLAQHMLDIKSGFIHQMLATLLPAFESKFFFKATVMRDESGIRSEVGRSSCGEGLNLPADALSWERERQICGIVRLTLVVFFSIFLWKPKEKKMKKQKSEEQRDSGHKRK